MFAFSFHNMLAPGRYHPILTITHRGEGLDVIDRFAGGLSFVVSGSVASGGMVEMPVQTEVAAAARARAESQHRERRRERERVRTLAMSWRARPAGTRDSRSAARAR